MKYGAKYLGPSGDKNVRSIRVDRNYPTWPNVDFAGRNPKISCANDDDRRLHFVHLLVLVVILFLLEVLVVFFIVLVVVLFLEKT